MKIISYILLIYRRCKAQKEIKRLLKLFPFCQTLEEKEKLMYNIRTIEYKYHIGAAKYCFDYSEYEKYVNNFKNVL